jgi:hypothetical protein
MCVTERSVSLIVVVVMVVVVVVGEGVLPSAPSKNHTVGQVEFPLLSSSRLTNIV